MPKEEYVPNNSFMTSQVKPKPFGDDYEDPLEVLKASIAAKQKSKEETQLKEEVTPTDTPTDILTYSPTDIPTDVPTYTRTGIPASQVEYPVSADRDFAKMPNSVKRALEQGWFVNSSFKVYYYLFNLTRTAIRAKRIVQIAKPQLMSGSSVKSERSLNANIAYLESIGLIKKTVRHGDQKGNLFEVFRPEEVPLGDTPHTYLHTDVRTDIHTDTPTDIGKKSTYVPTDINAVGSAHQTPVNVEENEPLRLSYKTLNSDDEAPRVEIFSALDQAARKSVGKGLTGKDYSTISNLFKILISETDDAVTRAGGATNYFSLMLENYQRLIERDRQKAKKGSPKITDTVGKPGKQIEEYAQPKSADEIDLDDMEGIDLN